MSIDVDRGPDSLDEAAAVADAVLFEGYLLYPYRASAQKNALRWQFGVLVPRAFGERDAEPWRSRTECVLDPRRASTLRLRLRFLHLQERSVLDVEGTERQEITVDGVGHLAWEEGVVRQVDATLALDDLRSQAATVPIAWPPTEEREAILDVTGTVAGHYLRRTHALTGRVVVDVEGLPGPYGALRLRLDVTNDASEDTTERATALRSSLISAHTVLALDAGAFLSSADPPEWAAPAVAACVNEHSWPVLAGPEGTGSLLLASPIILSDHPQLAPESPTNLFDGTENDEILTLRTMALTDDEKREARATDPRAAHIVDAVDAMGEEMFARLHGTIRPGGRAPTGSSPDGIPTLTTPRTASPDVTHPETPPTQTPWWDPAADASVDPETDSVAVDGGEVARGSTVTLWPSGGGDVQDQFLLGAPATVQAVLHDVDGGTHVAVSLDAEPTDLQVAHGRFRYFRPDELVVRAHE